MWYEIKWQDAHGNTITVQRETSAAFDYVAEIRRIGCTLLSAQLVES